MVKIGSSIKLFAGVGLAVPRLGNVRLRLHFLRRGTSGGTVVIEYSNLANAIHELKHAYQHISGDVELIAGTGGGRYVDITDEQKAYIRQYFFQPSSVSQLNSDAIQYIRNSKDISADFVRKLWAIDVNGIKVYPYINSNNIELKKP